MNTKANSNYGKMLLGAMIAILSCGKDAPDTPVQAISETLLPALTEEQTITFCEAQQQLIDDVIGLEQLIAVNCLTAVPQSNSDGECVRSVDECVAAGGDGDLDATRQNALNHIRMLATSLGTICLNEPDPVLCPIDDRVCPSEVASLDCDISVQEVRACLLDSASLVQEQFIAFECSEPRTRSSLFYLQGYIRDNFFNSPESCQLLSDRCSPF